MVSNRITKLQNTLKVFEILSPIAVTWQKLEPVIRMTPVKMTGGSKYVQISLGPIGKLLFLPFTAIIDRISKTFRVF